MDAPELLSVRKLPDVGFARAASYVESEMRWHDLDDPKAFSAFMDSLDCRLRDDGVPIAHRPLTAMARVSGELKISFTRSSNVATRINGWYQDRYGERLSVHWSIGRLLVLVRGDVYVARCPLVYGTASLSLLRTIDGVTPTTLATLPPEELASLVTVMKHGFDNFMALTKLPRRELLADGDSAVSQLMATPPNPGLSKWSSQQCVEKVLNAFVESKGGDLKRARKGGAHAHDFAPLLAEAQKCGLAALDAADLKRVECTANVRYADRDEGRSVTLAHAVEANQSAAALCAAIARQW